jgi:thioredoxin-related protein
MGSLSSLLAISSKMIKRLTTFTILLCLLPALLQAAVTRDPYQYFFQPSLGDLTEELEIAREEGKQGIFIFFEMDECPFCHRMKETMLNQPDVQAYFAERFHSLSMDIEGDIEMVDFAGTDMTQKEFARQNRVRATPLLVFFDLEGKPLLKYVGAPSSKQELIWMGEFVAEKVYLQKDDTGRNIRFVRYKRMKKENAL